MNWLLNGPLRLVLIGSATAGGGYYVLVPAADPAVSVAVSEAAPESTTEESPKHQVLFQSPASSQDAFPALPSSLAGPASPSAMSFPSGLPSAPAASPTNAPPGLPSALPNSSPSGGLPGMPGAVGDLSSPAPRSRNGQATDDRYPAPGMTGDSSSPRQPVPVPQSRSADGSSQPPSTSNAGASGPPSYAGNTGQNDAARGQAVGVPAMNVPFTSVVPGGPPANGTGSVPSAARAFSDGRNDSVNANSVGRDVVAQPASYGNGQLVLPPSQLGSNARSVPGDPVSTANSVPNGLRSVGGVPGGGAGGSAPVDRRGNFPTRAYDPSLFQYAAFQRIGVPVSGERSSTETSAQLASTAGAPTAYSAQQQQIPQQQFAQPAPVQSQFQQAPYRPLGVSPVAYQCQPAAGYGPTYPPPGAVPGNYTPPTLTPNMAPGVYSPNNSGFRPLFTLGQENYNVTLGRGIIGQPTAYVPGQGIRNFMRYLFP